MNLFGLMDPGQSPILTCLYCGHECQHIVRTSDPGHPKTGDWLVCDSCLKLHRFVNENTIRKLYEDEIGEGHRVLLELYMRVVVIPGMLN